MDLPMDLSPKMRYRRQLAGADFSLEANTEAAPEPGHFYVLRRGKVELKSDEFPEAMEAYQELCRQYWESHIDSNNAEERLACAWGLIGLEPENRPAADVIRQDGGPEDRKRMEQIRNRKRYAKRRGGRFGRAAQR